MWLKAKEIICIKNMTRKAHRICLLVGANETLARIHISSGSHRDFAVSKSTSRSFGYRNTRQSGGLFIKPTNTAIWQMICPKIGRSPYRLF
jgi:hypothetical protein